MISLNNMFPLTSAYCHNALRIFSPNTDFEQTHKSDITQLKSSSLSNLSISPTTLSQSFSARNFNSNILHSNTCSNHYHNQITQTTSESNADCINKSTKSFTPTLNRDSHVS